MFPIPEGPVALQYQSRRNLPSSYKEYRFVGLEQQTILLTESQPRNWQLRFSGLSGEEASRIRSCYETSAPLEEMSFVDPWTGLTHSKVRFGAAGLGITQNGPASFDVEFQLEGSL